MEKYSLNPSQISMDHFHELTRTKKMLPGRVMLHEEMDQRFDLLKKAGVTDLGILIRTLGSASKIDAFASQSGLPRPYLVLLKREAGSYLAKPFPISDFPGIPYEYSEVLKSKGIKHTRQFFEEMQSATRKNELAHLTGIPNYRLKELYSLCDLSRITGVGGIFSRVVYEAGIRSTGEFAEITAAVHYRKYKTVIDKYGYSTGHISEEDIQYCIEYARVIIECGRKNKLK
jgi:nucleotidyltransferase/DNA polymerase involved in DNA repair